MTTTRSAPMSIALRAAICPTPPAPHTATTSPAFTSAWCAPVQPVGAASEANRARSSETPSGNGEGALVGVGHPHVRGVAARVPAQRVGVPVAAADPLTPQRLGDPRVGVAVVAQGPQLLLAVPALPAAGEGDHHHPVADLVLGDVLADLGHRAHELVPEHVTGAHRGDVAAQQVQVRAAGHRQADLEDDVVVVEDLRLRDVLHPDLVDAPPGHRLHRTPPLGARFVAASRAARAGVAFRLPCGAGSTASTSPTSISCLALRSADRRSPCGSLPVSLAGTGALPEERWTSRAASSVP